MHRLTVLVLLQDEYTRSLIIRRVIFDHGGLTDPQEHIMHKNVIGCEFIIAMVGYDDLLTRHQLQNSLQGLAHR
jgi:hypothetical protein